MITQRQHFTVGNKKFQKREDLQSMLSIITPATKVARTAFFTGSLR
jgi:hypothetical protein